MREHKRKRLTAKSTVNRNTSTTKTLYHTI